MLKKNNVYLVSNLFSLQNLLEKDEMESLSRCTSLYEEKIAIQYISINNNNIIRIWKTNVLFDFWYNDFDSCGKNLIGTLDFTIFDSSIKIQHFYIHDSSNKNTNLYNFFLDENESEDLVKSLVHYIKKIAILFGKKRITIYVHENLRIFEKYYYFLGFKITNNRSKDNPFYLEAELTF